MKKPIILAADDDPQVLRAVQRDLRKQYSKEYKVLAVNDPGEALGVVEELKKKGENLALFVSDQRMPGMLGVEFLEQAKGHYPDAKRVLLTAYSDTDAAIKAINDVQLDYYLMKPWDPPEEKMYPVLNGLLEDWQMGFRPEWDGIKVVGYQFSPKSHVIKDFLAGNLIPFQWLDLATNDKATTLMGLFDLDEQQVPLVVFADGSYLIDPPLAELGERVGLKNKAAATMYDVVVIGAGPAGLAASVYGASEGLNTLLIERRAPGGQAGTSSRIENYLGFPTGLSGSELTQRAVAQAQRLGTEFLTPQAVQGIELVDGYKQLTLADGNTVNSKALVITTGVDYRQLEAPGMEKLTGAGIYYGAATTEAQACSEQEVYVVGGGNSAGQAAMYLSKFAKNVYILIRKPDLVESMSHYLIEQIANTPNIHLVPRTVVAAAHGEDRLTGLTLRSLEDDSERQVEASSLFIFIGARPITDWLEGKLLLDDKGFVLTGRDLVMHPDYPRAWKRDREPFLLETCVPGIFAAGDVRSGAMNRVASAVGEGSMSIKLVHQYLAE